MRVRAKIEGRDALMARLRSIVPEAEKNLAQAQLEGAQELANRIKPRVRVRTGKYRDSIQGDKLSNRPNAGGRAKRQTKDPNATGIFALWRWHFDEFGTVNQPAHPAIFPTYRAYKKQLRRKMANAVNKAVRAKKKSK